MKEGEVLPASMKFQISRNGFGCAFVHLLWTNVTPVLVELFGRHLFMPDSFLVLQPLLDPVSKFRIAIHRATRGMGTDGIGHIETVSLLRRSRCSHCGNIGANTHLIRCW